MFMRRNVSQKQVWGTDYSPFIFIESFFLVQRHVALHLFVAAAGYDA